MIPSTETWPANTSTNPPTRHATIATTSSRLATRTRRARRTTTDFHGTSATTPSPSRPWARVTSPAGTGSAVANASQPVRNAPTRRANSARLVRRPALRSSGGQVMAYSSSSSVATARAAVRATCPGRVWRWWMRDRLLITVIAAWVRTRASTSSRSGRARRSSATHSET